MNSLLKSRLILQYFLLFTFISLISCSKEVVIIEETLEEDGIDESVNVEETNNEETNNGDNQESSKSCLITFGENYLVFEAEDTDSPLDLWKLIKKGDNDYLDKESVGPINGTHLEFTGNNIGSGPATSPLEYTFEAPTTGVYRVLMRMQQRLMEGIEEDKSNDVFIKMEGDFTSATDKYTTTDLKTDLKFYGRGVNEWGSIHNGDGGAEHNKSAILYNLKEGESYTFTMSGRSKNANIDYILFYDTSISINGGSHKDIAELNDVKYRPDWDCSQSN
ncbi:hypothetical protein [Maribacter sp. IgM3_T14_3]|uniref:hypothetical protein n=1 Tax=Maribacter sp. IgM3_T14_3 TaxID=3415140 RepID=UPI003C6FD82B